MSSLIHKYYGLEHDLNTLDFKKYKNVLDELLQNSNTKCNISTNTYKTKTNGFFIDCGELTINNMKYSLRYYKQKYNQTFKRELYTCSSKIITAALISMYTDKVDIKSVSLTFIGYIFGDTILPILLTNYSLNYAYKYYLSFL